MAYDEMDFTKNSVGQVAGKEDTEITQTVIEDQETNITSGISIANIGQHLGKYQQLNQANGHEEVTYMRDNALHNIKECGMMANTMD